MASVTPAPRLRLAAGRTPLRRGDNSLQLGIDPDHALVVDDLAPGQAELLCRLDGQLSNDDLIAATGADREPALRLLTDLLDAGLVQPVDGEHDAPPMLAPDAAAWSLRTGRGGAELLNRRAGATVAVHGDGRIAVGVATALVAAGIGTVEVHTAGRVHEQDVGTGYLASDVGQWRCTAAAAAVRRASTAATDAVTSGLPDVAVLTDCAVWQPHLALHLVAERVPHLAVHAREASVVVGPLVLPGRTACLRCTDLYRAELDPSWPLVAAQLAARTPAATLPGALVAAAMAAEQVLALLAGRGEPRYAPPAAGTTFEVDTLHCRVVRRRWPGHSRCGCGAVIRTTGPVAAAATADTGQSGPCPTSPGAPPSAPPNWRACRSVPLDAPQPAGANDWPGAPPTR